MQLIPNMYSLMSSAQFTRTHELDWKGPGWYLEADRTILVVPHTAGKTITSKNVWNKNWKVGTIFLVLVWFCSVNRTIFPYIETAPIVLRWKRKDIYGKGT